MNTLLTENTFWGALLVLLNFVSIILVYRFWGKEGLFMHIPISIILANMQVMKTIELFGFVSCLGNAMFGGTFLISDILAEKYGKKEAQKAVWMGFFSLLATSIFMGVALAFTPHESDTAQASLEAIFTRTPRLLLAGLFSYAISQQHDIWAYHFWKSKFPELKFLFIRNNLSTLFSQALDTALFTYIAFGAEFSFLGFSFHAVFPSKMLWEIGLLAYLFKFIIAALDTPFLYWAVKIKPPTER